MNNWSMFASIFNPKSCRIPRGITWENIIQRKRRLCPFKSYFSCKGCYLFFHHSFVVCLKYGVVGDSLLCALEVLLVCFSSLTVIFPFWFMWIHFFFLHLASFLIFSPISIDFSRVAWIHSFALFFFFYFFLHYVVFSRGKTVFLFFLLMNHKREVVHF